MIRFPFRKGMILISKRNPDYQIELLRQDGMRWKCRKLTKRTGVYNGSHTMSHITLWKNFDPI